MRIIIVEDQVILRESLAMAIDSQDDMEVVASLADARLAPEEAERLDADLLLMDICTENDASGIVAARVIKKNSPHRFVIIMTGMPEVSFLDQAREAGADSFMYKNVGTKELLNVIRSTANGYSTFPNEASKEMDGIKLSQPEIDILRLVCEAKSRKEIAAELYLSEGTVKRRISEILAKTGYKSIMKLAVHAVSNGFILPQIDNEGEEAADE